MKITYITPDLKVIEYAPIRELCFVVSSLESFHYDDDEEEYEW